MFRRLVFENSTAIVTIIAFFTASSIYLAFAWRALRMRRAQLTFLQNLRFETPTPREVAPSSAPETVPSARASSLF